MSLTLIIFGFAFAISPTVFRMATEYTERSETVAGVFLALLGGGLILLGASL